MEPKTAHPRLTRLRLKRIGLVLKQDHSDATQLALELGKLALSKGFSVALAKESAEIAGALSSGRLGRSAATARGRERTVRRSKPELLVVPKKEDLVRTTDLIVVLGGDGTFLSMARLMRARSVPVLGINMGQLGFLTETKRSEATDTLAQVLAGKPVLISQRTLLEATLLRHGKVIHREPVVNDAVISKGAFARIIGLQVSVNGKWAHTVRADGIIVSTPTGSTAYSLAAGGPILEPTVPAIVLTTISPHSLTQRPLVIPDRSEIRIDITQRPGHVMLTLDGQNAFDMTDGDTVVVRRFPRHTLKLVSSQSRDYFSLLREKFRFGERE
jgi:NAD+ kinase